MRDIAEECGCGASTVSRWLSKHDIEKRQGKPEPADRRLTDADWLREQYVEQEQSSVDIAEECDCTHQPVLNWLYKHGIKTRACGNPTDQRLTDPEWLREQYVEQKQTTYDIAEKCNCSQMSVRRWLRKHDIKTRGPGAGGGRPTPDQRLTNPEWLREQYVERELSILSIAEKCGCSGTAVSNWLNEHGIGTRPTHPSGKDHPNWRGGYAAYGPGWNSTKRQRVRERDGFSCQDPNCDVTQTEHRDRYGQKLHVHHLMKARDVDDPEERNAMGNLVTLCRDCHMKWEQVAKAGIHPQIEGVTVE
jgi:transposase-like protein